LIAILVIGEPKKERKKRKCKKETQGIDRDPEDTIEPSSTCHHRNIHIKNY